MMNRRSFLKRTTGGVAAAYAALNWEAPERPPEYWPLCANEELGQEPHWWADCVIDGRRHRLREVTLPSVDANECETIANADSFDFKHFRRIPNDVEMVLWAEPGRLLHLVELTTSRMIVPVEIAFERGVYSIDFEGAFIGIKERVAEQGLPTVGLTVRLRGEPRRWGGA